MRKTVSSVVLTPLLILALAMPAAADSEKESGSIELLTDETATVVAGDTAWLALNWTAEDGPVTDVALVLRKDPGMGVTVGYPTNTATYTGLMNGHELAAGEIDFTAIQVHVPASLDKKKVALEFEVRYTTGTTKETKKIKVEVPVVQYIDGDHLVIHDSVADVPVEGSAWVDVVVTGLAPLVEDVSLTASGPQPVAYPSDRSATSLQGDAQLEDGETDTARFLVDGADATPGTYEMKVEIAYTFGGSSFTRTAAAVVNIVG